MRPSHTTAPQPEATAARTSPARGVYTLPPLDQRHLQRGVEHLYTLGPRAGTEFLAEVGQRIGGMPCILGLLAEYEQRLTPAMLRLTGGDRFPRRPLPALTVASAQRLLLSALTCERPNPRVAYISPTFGQAKRAAWDYLKEMAAPVLKASPHESELRLDLVNGAPHQLFRR